MNRNIETFRIEWSGIAIEIRYEPHWLGMDIGYDTAHLEIESIAPERAHLPITETGYRSHFNFAGQRCRLRRPRRLRREHGSKPKARHPTGDARNSNAGSFRCSSAPHMSMIIVIHGEGYGNVCQRIARAAPRPLHP